MTTRGVVRNARVLDAMTILFIVPNALFAVLLTRFPMTVLLAGCAGASVLTATRARSHEKSAFLDAPVDVTRLLMCALVSIALLVLAGSGHLLYANWDWLFRDAVLADLVRASDLPTYSVDGMSFLLRAPLGMYLLPAVVGRLLGLGFAHAMLFLQNASLLSGILYLFAGSSSKRWLVVVSVFIAFSGLDILGIFFWHWMIGRPLALHAVPSQIETWIGYQYSSHVTQLFWVPNHCLPGWWLALLSLLCARGQIGAERVGLSLAACLLWSPLAVAGALPLAGVALLTRFRDTIGDGRFWIGTICALGFLPVALYLTGDSARVPHAILIWDPTFWIVAPIFLTLEIPMAVVIVWARSILDNGLRQLVFPAIAMLVVLPMFRVGLNNDLVMRGSIPALAVLAFASGEVLAQGWWPNPFRFLLASALAVIGAVTPAFEIARPFIFPPFAISDCNLLTAGRQAAPGDTLSNYLARPDHMPNGLLRESKDCKPLTFETAACWPDYPFDPTLGVWAHSNRELLQSERSLKEKPK